MNLADLFRKKSVEKIQADAAAGLSDADVVGGDAHLRRSLKLTDLTLMGIAAIIGAGIFAMIGKASFDGGPAVIFLFIFTAIACAFSALCYAEFASRLPVAGSAYTYAYASFGELVAWIIGWDLIVEYAIGNIAVAISWSDYFTGMLAGLKIPRLGINGINIPLHFTMDFVTAQRGFNAVTEALGTNGATVESLTAACKGVEPAVTCAQLDAYSAWTSAPHLGGLPIVCDLPALLIVVLITALVYIGIRESKRVGNVMTVLKIGVILMVIFLGMFYVNPANWSPFAPNGITGVMKGVSAVFFAYIGFDALSTMSEECEQPRRDLPRAMMYSLVICTVLYIALALVLTGMVSYKAFENVGDPLAFVFTQPGSNLPWISGIIAVSAVIALATVFLVFQIGQPRLWMAMSRDGLLPKIFSSIHPKFKTPWFATIVTGIVVAIPALFMNLTEVTDLASIGTLFAFLLVCGGVLMKDKDFGRENRFVPYINSQFIVPILFVVAAFTIVYLHGIAALNEKSKPSEVRISTEKLELIEPEDKYSAFDFKNLANPSVYSEGLGAFTNLFSVETVTKTWKIAVAAPDGKKEFSVSPQDKLIVVTPNGENAVNVGADESVTNLAAPAGNITVGTQQKEEKQSALSAFSHKIPIIVFLLLAIVMTVLCLTKRLTLIPVLGVLSCAYLMTELGVTNWMRFGLWMLVGLVVYFCYGFWNSKLGKLETAEQ